MESKEESLSKHIQAISQVTLNSSKTNDIYIPLQGKHTTNSEEKPFDLAEKIKEFFVFDDANSSDPRIMLLLGDTGSGKSVFAQQIFQQLCQVRKDNDPIPLWVSLPELQNPFQDAVEEVLKKQEFSEYQITEMKTKERFIFIVDGYDELHQFQNCYVTNDWGKWNAKILITCRSQALYYQKDPDKYFVPFDGEMRMPWLMRKLYVAPFSPDQIQAYVEEYNRLSEDAAIRAEDFDKITGLKELITTPFLLYLTVETLPDILAEQQANEDNQKITQAKLYDVFIERWFARQVIKMRGTNIVIPGMTQYPGIKQQFWHYCKRLAQQMHAKEVTVIPYSPKKTGGRLFGKQVKKDIWEEFFCEDTEILRSACPLKRMGEHHYGFIHASLVEYFATRAMYEEIQAQEDVTEIPEENKEKEEIVLVAENTENKLKGGIHYRVFAKEPNAIRNLADRIEMKETFKRKMLTLVEQSKLSERYAIGAANAITALVKAGVTFNGADLRGIRIAGADISGGYFDHADLSESDLKNVLLRRVWMRNARLINCQLEGINFGEYPYINHENKVKSIVYRPENNRLLTFTAKNVYVWDIEKEQGLHEFKGLEKEDERIAFSGDGHRMVSLRLDKTVRLWDLGSGKVANTLEGLKCSITVIALSHDGRTVVLGGYEDYSADQPGKVWSVRVWDVASGMVMKLLGHESHINCVAVSDDGGTLVTGGSWDKTVRVWDVASGKVVVLTGHESEIKSVALSCDGHTVVSGSDDATVRVWDIASGQAVVLEGHEYGVESVNIGKDGRTVISGGKDSIVRVWDVSSRKVEVFRGHQNVVTCVTLSDDGLIAASGSEDNTVRMWEVGSGQVDRFLFGHQDRVMSVAFSKNGRFVSSGSRDTTVRVWDAISGQAVILQGHNNVVTCVAISNDGRTVVSGSADKTVRVWDVATWQTMKLLEFNDEVSSVAISDNDRISISWSEGDKVCVWDAISEQAIVLLGHKDGVWNVALNRNGSKVVSGSKDNTVRVWDIASGQATVLHWHDLFVETVYLSDNARIVAANGRGHMGLEVWDVASGKSVVLQGHKGGFHCTYLCNDGRTVISGGYDKTVRIWDIKSRSQIDVIHFDTMVNSISVHEESKRLVVGHYEGTVHVWQCLDDRWQNWQLVWSSTSPNLLLFIADCNIARAIGLSNQNERLMLQRGTINSEAKRHPRTTEPSKVVVNDQRSDQLEKPPQKAEKTKVSESSKKFGGVFFKKRETAVKPPEESPESVSQKKGLSRLKLFNRSSKAVESKSRIKHDDKDDASPQSFGKGNSNE